MILDRQALAAAAAMVFLALPAAGQPVFPGRDWQSGDAAAMGWSSPRLAAARDSASGMGASAVMIVQHGRVVASWGDPARRVRVNSMRKSVLSALYGLAIAEGRIDLGATLADLDIDDTPPALSPAEKRATVRDLLMARSGVYHDAASESEAMKSRRPARGGHAPGAHWYYNNWDFNALGTIWRQRTGEDIFAAVERRIARPIGMVDFTAADGAYVASRVSRHPTYHMDFTARDLARFGWLYLQRGRWDGHQVIPAAWVEESTRPLTRDVGPGIGYGYLWWASTGAEQLGVAVGPGAYSARGYGGQYLFVLPAHDMVVVLLHAAHVADKRAGEVLRRIMAAAPPPGPR